MTSLRGHYNNYNSAILSSCLGMENTQEMNESETTNPDDISPGSPSIWWTCGNQIMNPPKQHWKHCLEMARTYSNPNRTQCRITSNILFFQTLADPYWELNGIPTVHIPFPNPWLSRFRGHYSWVHVQPDLRMI